MIPNRRWPWVAQQNWKNILFIHTPVNEKMIQLLVPFPIEIDTFQGTPWISVVLFRASGSRLRGMPKPFSYPDFYQMNVRTYVRFGDERGVYFFAIHGSDPIVNFGGNLVGLPFIKAPMIISKEKGIYSFKASQLFQHPQSKLHISYKPLPQKVHMHPTSLAHFLTERYAIWMVRNNHIVKAPITHSPWNLHEATLSTHVAEHIPFPLTDHSVIHYAEDKHTVIHPFEKVGIVSPLP